MNKVVRTLAVLVVLALPATAAAAGTAGLRIVGSTAPSAQKPQSKLWFNDGSWWGILFRTETRAYEIFRYADGAWTPTGTQVDTRHNVFADALWDGSRLSVVSAGSAATANGVRYRRYSYDPSARRYRRDVDAVDLTGFGVKAAVIDRDDAGRLWVTYTHDAAVWVTHTTTTDPTSWTAPFSIGDGLGDDISSVVHLPGRIGVLWSNQNDWSFRFATHADGAADSAWDEETALQRAEFSDDHINVKTLSNDPAGTVFAAVKTSLNRPDDPLVLLLVRGGDGTWAQYPVFRVRDQPTRPQVVLDPVRRKVHVLATLGPCCAGGRVVVKTADLDHIGFALGTGTALLSSDTDTHINNVTSTKQAIEAAMSFLPILATDDKTRRYWTNTLLLSGASTSAPESRPATTPAVTPAAAPSASAPAPATSAPARPAARRALAAISRVRLLRHAFRARTGTSLRFTLTEAARVTLRAERRKGKRWVRVPGAQVVAGRKGANSVRFRPRVRRASYRLVIALPGRKAVRTGFRIA